MQTDKAATRTVSRPRSLYTWLWIEALAYHEAGHAIMGLLFRIPVVQVAIAEACELEDSNGSTEYGDLAGVSRLDYALCLLASEPAEKLAPHFQQFSKLRGFATGRRNDRALAFEALAPVYQALGLAESTARRRFRERTGPFLARIMEQPENQAVVHELAAHLMVHKTINATTLSRFRAQLVLPDEIANALL
jgi:hypothetical protein